MLTDLRSGSGHAWWTRQLSTVQNELARQLRNRVVSDSHADDLTQDILHDLVTLVQRQSGDYPTTWHEERDDVPDTDRRTFYALVATLRRRRLADYYRSPVRREILEDVCDRDESMGRLDEGFDARRLLRAALRIVGDLDPGERELLLRDITPGNDQQDALSAAERKRLQRLRERLRAEVSAVGRGR